jgi:hypothetical protein
VQLDELYAVLRDLKTGEISEDEAIQRLERSLYWVWTAMDPDSKLLLVIDVGTRTLAMAQRVVHQVVQVLAQGGVPLCLTDGHRDYTMAFLAHWGYWVQPERQRERGPAPKPRWRPLPALLYAQVVKSYRRRRIMGVTYGVVFGTMERVQQVLSACGRKMNTAFVELLNLDLRQRVAAVGVGSPRSVRARTAYASSWSCTKCTTIAACLMRVCASPCWFLSRPTAGAPLRCGARVHRRWRRD